MLDFSDDGERLDHFDLAAAEALAKSSLRAALQVQRRCVAWVLARKCCITPKYNLYIYVYMCGEQYGYDES